MRSAESRLRLRIPLGLSETSASLKLAGRGSVGIGRRTGVGREERDGEEERACQGRAPPDDLRGFLRVDVGLVAGVRRERAVLVQRVTGIAVRGRVDRAAP